MFTSGAEAEGRSAFSYPVRALCSPQCAFLAQARLCLEPSYCTGESSCIIRAIPLAPEGASAFVLVS
jgi:hypothetical protein